MDPIIDFFVSYASSDEEWARAIDRWLNDLGYRTWFAARDERGRWGPELERALARFDTPVPVKCASGKSCQPA